MLFNFYVLLVNCYITVKGVEFLFLLKYNDTKRMLNMGEIVKESTVCGDSNDSVKNI